MNNAKNVYLLAISVANEHKRKYYLSDLPVVSNYMQELAEYRINTMKSLWDANIKLENQCIGSQQAAVNSFNEAVMAINPQADSNTFVHYHQKQWTEPADFIYEPPIQFQDNDKMVTDPQADVFLANKVGKADRRLEDIEGDLHARQIEIDGLENLQKAYTANPALGDAFEVNEVRRIKSCNI